MTRDKFLVRWGLKAALIAAACALWGCEGKTAGRGPVDTPQSRTTVLNATLDAEISTLDPQAAVDSASFDLIGCTTEGLYTIDKDGLPVMAMAESAKKSENGLSYEVKLKEAFWSDGSPVTARDFVYGWRRSVDPGRANENSFMLQVGGILNAKETAAGEMPLEKLGIRAVDDRTLVINLDRPVPYFESLMAFPTFYPVKESFELSCKDQFGTSPETLLSNGPFVITGYEPATQVITLDKSETYWDRDHVFLDGIRFQVVKDSQQGVMAYEKGELDMALLSGDQAERYRASPEFHSIPLGSLWYLSPNQRRAGLDNKNLRMALALCYDRSAITDGILKDGSQPAMFAVPSLLAKGPDGKDFREDSDVYLQTDKALAAAYWENAKQELGIEAVTMGLLVEDTEAAMNIGQFLQSEIEKSLPGVTVQIEQVPKKMRIARMESGDYDIGLTRWGADYADPLAFLGMWSTDSPYNYGSWSNTAYDEIIESAQSGPLASDPDSRWEALREAESMVMEEAVIFPVCQKCNGVLIKPGVENVEYHTVGVNRIFKNVTKK